jgi:hypothetical protein
MEERGCEGGQQEDTFVREPLKLRIATYNILNTKGKV